MQTRSLIFTPNKLIVFYFTIKVYLSQRLYRLMDKKEKFCSFVTLIDVFSLSACSPNRLFYVHFTAVFRGGSSWRTYAPKGSEHSGLA